MQYYKNNFHLQVKKHSDHCYSEWFLLMREETEFTKNDCGKIKL